MRLFLLAYLWTLSGCPPPLLPGYTHPPPDGTQVQCPVSRKTCTKGPETEAAVYEDQTYYFCCPDCRERFAQGPQAYLR